MDARLDGFEADTQQILTTQSAFKLPMAEPISFYRRRGKRLLDIGLVLLSLPLVLPIILCLAIVVALDGGRPFFWQSRIGRGGESFRMLKLRSMRVDAEQVLTTLLMDDPAAAVEWRIHQKLQNDPRITWIGRWLRRSSLDELPQLWNVLRGDMSLVGPRPMLEVQSVLYPGTAYYSLRPGLTGAWQVEARNVDGFALRAEYDTVYAETHNFFRDSSLVLRTFSVVFRGTGQ